MGNILSEHSSAWGEDSISYLASVVSIFLLSKSYGRGKIGANFHFPLTQEQEEQEQAGAELCQAQESLGLMGLH